MLGKLNLPTLLYRVGLLILIKMDSLIYLDKYLDSLGIGKGSNLDSVTIKTIGSSHLDVYTMS